MVESHAYVGSWYVRAHTMYSRSRTAASVHTPLHVAKAMYVPLVGCHRVDREKVLEA